MSDYNVLFQDMPCCIKGFTKKNYEEDSYTIVLNSRLSVEEQRVAYTHEVQHIDVDDFYSDNADEIEYITHK